MKKFIAGLLTGVIIASVPVAFAVSKLFSDVPSNEWYSSAVNSLSEKGIIQGYPDGTFGPTNNVNRAELAVMLDRLIEHLETGETNLMTDWDIVKAYVTSNYPISESYFDTHFQFVSSTPGGYIQGDYDYDENEFSKLLTNLTTVDYTFKIDDAQGNPQNFTSFTNIYLHDGKVIEADDMPSGLSDYEQSNFRSRSYDIVAPTRELDILVTKNDAIDIATTNSECTDPDWFDVNTAEKNLDLEFTFGEINWNWQDGLSYCKINAETEEVQVNQQLPD